MGVRALNRKTVGPFLEELDASRQGEPPFPTQKPSKCEWAPPQPQPRKKPVNQKQMGLWVKEDS